MYQLYTSRSSSRFVPIVLEMRCQRRRFLWVFFIVAEMATGVLSPFGSCGYEESSMVARGEWVNFSVLMAGTYNPALFLHFACLIKCRNGPQIKVQR